MHQHSSVHLPYPTPSINLHTFVINPHASTPTTFTYIFSSFRASPIISNSLTRGRWCTLPVNIGPDFCRSSGPNMPSSPFKVFHPTPFPFSLRFWFIYPFVSRWGLVRSCPPQLSICYIFCIMCTCFWTYDTPYSSTLFLPLPKSPFFRSFPPSAGFIETGFVVSSYCENKHFLCERSSLGLSVSLRDQMVALFLVTLQGQAMFGPPFRSTHCILSRPE